MAASLEPRRGSRVERESTERGRDLFVFPSSIISAVFYFYFLRARGRVARISKWEKKVVFCFSGGEGEREEESAFCCFFLLSAACAFFFFFSFSKGVGGRRSSSLPLSPNISEF